MRDVVGMVFLLLLLTYPTASTAGSAVLAGSSGGTTLEERSPPPDGTLRKIDFMDGSVGFVRPDGTVLFEKEPKEPPPPDVRIRLQKKDKGALKKEGPAEPDWYSLSKPAGKAGERIWTGPAALFGFGEKSGKVLTINADGSLSSIQVYTDGSRIIDDEARPRLRRILPDGTVLLMERPR